MIVIDTSMAIKNGISKKTIIDNIEKYFNMEYWQDVYDWDPYFTFFYIDHKRVVARSASSSKPFRTIEIIDWYDIAEDSNMPKTLKKEDKFNEELL